MATYVSLSFDELIVMTCFGDMRLRMLMIFFWLHLFGAISARKYWLKLILKGLKFAGMYVM